MALSVGGKTRASSSSKVSPSVRSAANRPASDANTALRTKAVPGKKPSCRKSQKGGRKRNLGPPVSSKGSCEVDSSIGGHTLAKKTVKSFGGLTKKTSATGLSRSLGGRTKGTGAEKTKLGSLTMPPFVRKSSGSKASRIEPDLTQEASKGNPLLVGMRKPKETWTCNLCQMVFQVTPGKSTLAKQRWNHIASRHPNDGARVGTIREYIAPVEASEHIPLTERAWVCPFCDKALPALSKTVKEVSVKHHYKKHHPRRKIVASKLTALRWKLAKKDPNKVINYRDCKKRLGDALRGHAAARRKTQMNSHHLVPVAVNWDTWPRSPRAAYRTGDVLLTCTYCRSIGRGSGGSRFRTVKCPGTRDKPWPSQRVMWNTISKDNRQALCNAWAISLCEAQEWFSTNLQTKQVQGWERDLCAEGIEPNPGPSASHFDLFCLNTQGASGAWGFLKSQRRPKTPTVLLLQETRMRWNETQTFRRAARRAGFHSYFVEGTDNGGVPRGGVLTLVDSRLRSRVAFAQRTQNSQLLSVWIEEGLCFNHYSPPPGSDQSDPQNELAGLYVDAFESLKPPNGLLWVAGGDSNEVPMQSTVEHVLRSYGGQTLSQGTGTRWESDREIDWFCTNFVRAVEDPKTSDLYLSDHKLIFTRVAAVNRPLVVGQLPKTPLWTKPKSVSVADWRSLLEKCWMEVDLVLDPVCTPAQTAWDMYNAALHDMFRSAFAQVAQNPAWVSDLDTVHIELKKCTPKGVRPKWKCRSQLQTGPPESAGCMKLRKARKALGRCFELKKIALRQIRQPDSANLKTIETLCKHLCSANRDLVLNPADLGDLVRILTSHIKINLQELKELERQSRQSSLDKWRDFILHDPSGLGRWLRQREMASEAVQVQFNEKVESSPMAVGALIFDFWRQFWGDYDEQAELRRDRLLRQYAAEAHDFEWVDPSIEDLFQIVRKAKGSGSVDGWSGDEIRHIPADAIRVFRNLALEWGKQKAVPEQFLDTRSVHLPKASKVKDGILNIDDLRPISVMCVFWRVWASALVKSPSTKEWINRAIPPEVVAGSGPSAEAQVAAGEILHAISVDGFGCTLDFSKCYDLMNPRGTLALMRQGGFPSHVVDLCEMVWTGQRRWILWDNCVHPRASPAGRPGYRPRGPLWSPRPPTLDDEWF